MMTFFANNPARRTDSRLLKSVNFILLALTMVSLHVQGQTAPGATGPVIDNERVAVWDIVLTPGQPTSLQRHENDFVTMFLVGGDIRTTDGNAKTSVVSRNFGDAVYRKKGTEEEEVISGSPARLIVVELKDHPVPPLVNKSGYPAAFPRPGSKKVLDNERVVIWWWCTDSRAP
jgi:hypothetical protein